MSILGALRNTAQTLEALSRATEVVQHNVANASTPGYARQRISMIAKPFDPGITSGGVQAGRLESSRDPYLEASVRRLNLEYGGADQKSVNLQELERIFDVTGKSGPAASMSALYAAFSNWSVAPNDTVSRNRVVAAARATADSFRSVSNVVDDVSVQTETQTSQAVAEINRLVSSIRELNRDSRELGVSVESSDAALHDYLERLSALTDVTATQQPDGQVSLFLASRVPLLTGDEQTELAVVAYHEDSPTYPGGLPRLHVLAGDQDATDSITEGRLGALLHFRNTTLTDVAGGSEQVGKINELAAAFASRVNAISQAANGPAIFSFDANDPTSAAASLAVVSTLAPSDLVAGSTSGNDVALKLAGLADSRDPSDQIDRQNYTSYWAALAAEIGGLSSTASENAKVRASVLAQVRALRAQESGVSLDEEALHLVELQRAFEATSRMARVLSDMTETIVGLLR